MSTVLIHSTQDIHRQTLPVIQRQHLLGWRQSSYIEKLWWWHNSNANCLCHILLLHMWLRPKKFRSPPFPNGMGRPRRNHSYLNKLRLTSLRHTMYVSKIELKRQQKSNTSVLQIILTCSPPYLVPDLQFFWTTPGLLLTGLPCCLLCSLTLAPPAEKISLSRSQTSLALKWKCEKAALISCPTSATYPNA